jgi:hypothetical protein
VVRERIRKNGGQVSCEKVDPVPPPFSDHIPRPAGATRPLIQMGLQTPATFDLSPVFRPMALESIERRVREGRCDRSLARKCLEQRHPKRVRPVGYGLIRADVRADFVTNGFRWGLFSIGTWFSIGTGQMVFDGFR